jgi:hypothetical protein
MRKKKSNQDESSLDYLKHEIPKSIYLLKLSHDESCDGDIGFGI